MPLHHYFPWHSTAFNNPSLGSLSVATRVIKPINTAIDHPCCIQQINPPLCPCMLSLAIHPSMQLPTSHSSHSMQQSTFLVAYSKPKLLHAISGHSPACHGLRAISTTPYNNQQLSWYTTISNPHGRLSSDLLHAISGSVCSFELDKGIKDMEEAKIIQQTNKLNQ